MTSDPITLFLDVWFDEGEEFFHNIAKTSNVVIIFCEKYLPEIDALQLNFLLYLR